MNILITGGSGFIGRHLVEYLSQKYRVLAPSHVELDLVDDGAVHTFLEHHPVDVVIHAAGKPGHRNAKDPTNIFYTNARMFFNMLQNAGRFGKMIVIGSGAVYDMRHYVPKMKEEFFDTHMPVDEHGFFRYVCAKCLPLTDNVIDLRVFGIFGKYEEYTIRFISNAICKTLFDLPVTIKQNRKFDYIYIKDLFPVIDHFMHHKGAYREYNVTPDYSIELLTLADKIVKISGKHLPIVIGQNGMGLEYSGDNSRLRQEMRSLAFTDVDLAISELYNWYAANKHLINREALLVDK